MGKPAKDKPAKTAKKAKAKGSGEPFSWGELVRAVSTATTVVLVAGVVGGLVIGRGSMQARAAGISASRAAENGAGPGWGGLTVEFDWPAQTDGEGRPRPPGPDGRRPTWLPPEIREQLVRIVANTATADPFDDASLRAAQRELMATGWFASPVVLTRERSGQVRVAAEWRTPFAAVRSRGQPQVDHYVTVRGELLPRSSPAGHSGLYVVSGAAANAPQRPGEVWPGSDIRDGLFLLWTIRAMPGLNQVAAIDVSSATRDGKRQLVIQTRYNTRIIWGGPADAANPGELSTPDKVRRMADLLARTGRIDGGQDVLQLWHPLTPGVNPATMSDQPASAFATPPAPPAPPPPAATHASRPRP